MAKKEKFFYLDLADRIQARIESGGYKLSEKLPSLRALCQSTGHSMTTVLDAYVELEKRGVVESRYRSGYFIRPKVRRLRPVPAIRDHEVTPVKISMDDLIHDMTRDMSDPNVLKLGAVTVAPGHLPVKRLHSHLRDISRRESPGLIAGYAHPQGDAQLRQQISNHLFAFIPSVDEEEIIVTNGCTEALDLSLKAVASPGDTIIVESPTDPWIRQIVKDSRMYAVEIPADPVTGMDLDRMASVLDSEKIAACIMSPNCQNPLGFIMSDDRKKTVLAMLGKQDIPVIENDIAGDIYFGSFRPNPLKTWDEKGLVLYCASFSKVLAPGLRVGWVIPGRFKQTVKRMKLNRSLISPTLNQALVAAYLKQGTYDRHLRRLRETIHRQLRYCAAAVHRSFPESVRMTSPSGGLSLWIELPRGVDSRDVYVAAKKKGISILPGFLCASFNAFERYIRIGYGRVWDQEVADAIEQIGKIVCQLAGHQNP
jgi:DNA-binding transcriptional MocR family regulator